MHTVVLTHGGIVEPNGLEIFQSPRLGPVKSKNKRILFMSQNSYSSCRGITLLERSNYYDQESHGVCSMRRNTKVYRTAHQQLALRELLRLPHLSVLGPHKFGSDIYSVIKEPGNKSSKADTNLAAHLYSQRVESPKFTFAIHHEVSTTKT